MSRQRLHRRGLSPATPGEELRYAEMHLGFWLGREIGSYHEELKPGEEDPLMTFTIYENEGVFRLLTISYERFDGQRWVAFEKFLRRPKELREEAPWVLASGDLALRQTRRVRTIPRAQALQLVRERVLGPGVGGLIPRCFAHEMEFTLHTLLPDGKSDDRRYQLTR